MQDTEEFLTPQLRLLFQSRAHKVVDKTLLDPATAKEHGVGQGYQ